MKVGHRGKGRRMREIEREKSEERREKREERREERGERRQERGQRTEDRGETERERKRERVASLPNDVTNLRLWDCRFGKSEGN